MPERLAREVRVGTTVVVPLSGYSQLGIVVGFEEKGGDRPLKEIQAVARGISLPEGLVRLCDWAAGRGPHITRRALDGTLARA